MSSEISRRDFNKVAMATIGGLLLGACAPQTINSKLLQGSSGNEVGPGSPGVKLDPRDFTKKYYPQLAEKSETQSNTIEVPEGSNIQELTYHNYTDLQINPDGLAEIYSYFEKLAHAHEDFTFPNALLNILDIEPRDVNTKSGNIYLIPPDTPYPEKYKDMEPYSSFTAQTPDNGFITVIRAMDGNYDWGNTTLSQENVARVSFSAEACQAVFLIGKGPIMSGVGQETFCVSAGTSMLFKHLGYNFPAYSKTMKGLSLDFGLARKENLITFPRRVYKNMPADISPVTP